MKVKSLLIFIMSLCMCSMFSMYGLAEGEPSKPKTNTTYSIGTEKDFKNFISDLEAVKAKTKDDAIQKVTLNNNIDISALDYCDLPFKATFDGNGKKILIKELKVDLKDVASGDYGINIGLLGMNEGTISNLAVEIEKITVTNAEGKDINIGGICGYNHGTQEEQEGGKTAIISGIIDQCFCYIGEVKCTGSSSMGLNIGGIAGKSDGIVSNCYSEVYLEDIVEVSQPLATQGQGDSVSLNAGGIVGIQDNRVNKGAMVSKCYSLGKINLPNGFSVGSICGYIYIARNLNGSVVVQAGEVSIPVENCMCLMNEVNGNSIFDTNFLVQDNKSLHIYDKCEYWGEVLAEKMVLSPSDLITYDDREFKLFIKGTNESPFDMLKLETGASGGAGTAKTTELWKLTDLGRNSKYICYLPELISISEDAQDPYSYLMLNKVYVDGIEVTKRNCKDILKDNNKNKGKVAYDARKNTLSINGIDIKKDGKAVTEGIKVKSDLVINSSGTNKIHGYCYGIRSDEGALVLEGTGGLNLQCGNSDSSSIGNSRGIYTGQDLTLSLDSKLSISDFENGIECGSDLINFKGVTEISNCTKGILTNGKYENWQGSTMKINKSTYGINQKDAGKKEEFEFEFKGGEVEVSSDSESMVATSAEGYDIKIVPPADKQVKVSYGTDKSQLSGEPKYYKSNGTFSCIGLVQVVDDTTTAVGDTDTKSVYKYLHLEEKSLDTVDDGNNDNKDNDNKDNDNNGNNGSSDDKNNNSNGDKNNGSKDNNKDNNNSSGDKTNNDNSSGSLDDDIFGGNSSTNGSIDNNLSGAGGTSATNVSTGDISDLFLIYALCVSALGIVLISLKLRKNK